MHINHRILAIAFLIAATNSTTQAQATDSTKAKPAATAASGPVGTWRGSLTTQNGPLDVNCVIRKDSTGYAGSFTGPAGDMPFKTLTVEGSKVTASANMSMQGTNIEIWYSFVLKDDTLSGTVSTNMGGQAMSFDLVLKRVIEK